MTFFLPFSSRSTDTATVLHPVSITSLREWIATNATLLVHILFAEGVANAKEGSC